jgi:hypothetical protein
MIFFVCKDEERREKMRDVKELAELLDFSEAVYKEADRQTREQLQEICKESGVSPKEFADSVGLSPEVLESIEEGTYNGSREALYEVVSKAIGIYEINE